MPVSGMVSFVTMMLVLVREWIWDILERGLEAGGLGAVPPEALGYLVFELPKVYYILAIDYKMNVVIFLLQGYRIDTWIS